MVKKKTNTETKGKGRAKIKKLQLNKETIKELGKRDQKQLRGGLARNQTDKTCLVIACSISCI